MLRGWKSAMDWKSNRALSRHGLRFGLSEHGMYPSKNFWREAHGDFELIVAFKDILVVLPAAESFPIDETLLPCEMAVNGNWIVAAVNHAVDEGFAEAFGDVAATDGSIECAGIAVEIFEASGHADEDMEVVGIEEATFGGAMGGDGGDAALEGQGEDARVSVFGADHWKCMFAAGVGKEG